MKVISFFGYANTTKKLALHVKNSDADTRIVFYDDKVTKPFTDKHGFFLKPPSEFNAKYSSLEISSPGIAPSHPLILKAKHLISEYDYFTKTMPFSIWISGTNGKTTTTQMLQHLLKSRGSVAGGNIGTALASLDIQAPIWILETSSFTLHYTNKAKPNIYILLPITPDHLSWHNNLQNYTQTKLKPLNKMREGDIAIIPKHYKNLITCKAYIIFYEDEHDLSKIFNIKLDKINFKGVFLLDAVLGLCIGKILFNEVDYKKINSFILDSHRQEKVFDKYERLWINDTKATNIDASKQMLKIYQNKYIHLILGGDDKNISMDTLFDYLKTLHVSIYAIGKNHEKIVALSKKYHLTCKDCLILDEAVKEINKSLTTQEVAILSPAAASLDQFQSYAHRGDKFKKIVALL